VYSLKIFQIRDNLEANKCLKFVICVNN